MICGSLSDDRAIPAGIRSGFLNPRRLRHRSVLRSEQPDLGWPSSGRHCMAASMRGMRRGIASVAVSWSPRCASVHGAAQWAMPQPPSVPHSQYARGGI